MLQALQLKAKTLCGFIDLRRSLQEHTLQLNTLFHFATRDRHELIS